jgi:hypothetical protein
MFVKQNAKIHIFSEKQGHDNKKPAHPKIQMRWFDGFVET